MKMNKEITVTLTEKSHKHAEMMIHLIANPCLIKIAKLDGDWSLDEKNINNIYFDINVEYFLCHPKHKEECLHWLNGGDVEFYCNETNQYLTRLQTFKHWQIESVFMNPDIEIRIKQEPEYVKVEFEKLYEAIKAWEDGEVYTILGNDYVKPEYASYVLEYPKNLYRKV